MNKLFSTCLKIFCVTACIGLILGGGLYIDREVRKDHYKPLLVLTSSDSAPFSFYDGHELVGFDIDLIRKIAKELDRTAQFMDVPFYMIFKKLTFFAPQEGDLAITAISQLPERNNVDFSIPYHASYSVLLVKKDSGIKSEYELSDKTIAVRKGSSQERLVQTEWIPLHSRIHTYTFYVISEKEINMLKNNQIYALVLDKEEAQIYLENDPSLKAIPLKGTESNICIALPKGSLLTHKINAIIRKFQNDGTLLTLEKKWFSQSWPHVNH